ncbi:MAG: non-heme iron oxygenase ferredoxin subunit [Ignavibacteriales bacterium]|nr:non-heme iron oxygenase ferredoxin subunit [Ignavibacteriales bacterium]
MAELKKVATVADVPAGTAKAVNVDGKKIALFNINGSFYAIDDTCTHRGGPLSEGDIEEFKVTCPWHGATYDVKTGKVLGPPATQGVARYNVTVEGSDIKIEV